MRKALCGVLAASLLLSACAEEGPGAVVASSQGSVGIGDSRRVLFSVMDLSNSVVLASPTRGARVDLADENGSPLASYPADFIWVDEDAGRGVYAAYLDLPDAATYRATLDVEGLAPAGPVGLVVLDDPRVLQPGEPAIGSPTRTLAEDPLLVAITSDPNPSPAFYELSLAEAISNRSPAVVVFGSPRWCASATCASLLDQVKALAPGYPNIDFVHVESYQDVNVDSAEDLTTVAAVADWGLPSEPWVFVVDSSGIIAASFEGVAADGELRAMFEFVAK